MHATLTEPAPAPATLKFRPPQPEESLDLQQCYERFCAIELRGKSPETVSEYRTHLRRWHHCWDDLRDQAESAGEPWEYRTTYPVLTQITRRELLAFEAWVASNVLTRQQLPVGNRSINKHLGTIKAVLGWAVKHGLLESAPKVDRRKERPARKLHLSLEEADRLKLACKVATWPRGLAYPAALYWEALICGWTVQGFRTQEQVRYESRQRSLHWSDIRWDRETPHPDGKAEHQYGWIVYRPDKNWDDEEPPLVVPMHSSYHAHLVAIRDTRQEVFPFPMNNREFYNQWKRIVSESGIKPKRGWDGAESDYQIKHLRKTAVKWINDDEARRILGRLLGEEETGEELLSAAAIGHTEAVSRRNYDHEEERLVMAYRSLRVPDSFRQPLYGGTRQLVMF